MLIEGILFVYRWLVRVLRTQEVGYIPAENIETPFERLARLNKHRNVDLASATDDDHIQVPSKIFSSHLVKQRDAVDRTGLSSHSGKLSALSQRKDGAVPKGPSQPGSKPSVIFGPCSYVEHSGDEFDTEEEDFHDEDGEYEEYDEEDDGAEEVEGFDVDSEGEDDLDPSHQEQSSRVEQHDASQNSLDVRSRKQNDSSGLDARTNHVSGSLPATAAGRRELLAGMEPDDGMEWDAQEAERIQAQKAVSASHSVEPSREPTRGLYQANQTQPSQSGRAPGSSYDNIPLGAEQDQRNQQARQQRLHTNEFEQVGQGRPSQAPSQQSRSASNGSLQEHPARTSSERTPSYDSGFVRTSQSQGPASRERVVSDSSYTSSNGPAASSFGRGSPTPQQLRKEKERRKSKNESFDANLEDGNTDNSKEGKKRSGVFSGLFSRNKDKKERKSGSFSSAGGGIPDDSTMMSRSSDDSLSANRVSARGTSPSSTYTAGNITGAGRGVQERDRGAQEAYHRQFLAQSQTAPSSGYETATGSTPRTGSGKPRPGSLMGTPGSVPMLNVVRVFAGDNIDSDATFKTVLLNQGTSTRDLVRQAMQRFRLSHGDYELTVKLVEGNERALAPEERPLQVLDRLSEITPESALMMPSVKRSSVGSISSISSNLSQHPAIARVNEDFSDDHAVKFYLRRVTPSSSMVRGNDAPPGRAGIGAGSNFATGLDPVAPSAFAQGSASELSEQLDVPGGLSPLTLPGFTGADAALSQGPQARFALRLVIFPADLPDGLVFDPQTNALLPHSALVERGPTGSTPIEGVEQRFREKILSLPRNATVAEVVEMGLDRFGIYDGLVEGGDDVEDRTSRRRSKPRVKYGLAVDVKRQGPGQEQHLIPNSRVVDAFPVQPIFKMSPAGKRRSTDSAMLLNMAAEQMRPTDPVFILRSMGSQSVGSANAAFKNGKSVRSLSPTEGRLAEKHDQRKQLEVSTVPTTAPPAGSNQDSRSRGIIAAQRAAAQERKAAVLGAQRNDQQGVDLFLTNNGKIRSSRSLEGKVRYSYLPELGQGEELDISAIVTDVLADEGIGASQDTASGGANGLQPRPAIPKRGTSTSTMNSAYVSAPSTPLPEDSSVAVPQAPLFSERKALSKSESRHDLLESFVRNPQTDEGTMEDRIDEVLSRVAGGGHKESVTAGNTGTMPTTGQNYSRVPPASVSSVTQPLRTGTNGAQQRVPLSQTEASDNSFSSNHDSSPRSASTSTDKSAGTNPTPLSTLGFASTAAGATVAGMTPATMAHMDTTATRGPTRRANQEGSAAYIPSDDFGLDHLYTIVDAASRRDPRKYTTRIVSRSASRAGSGRSPGNTTPTLGSNAGVKNNSVVAVFALAPEPEKMRPAVAGLFPPPRPPALTADEDVGGQRLLQGGSGNGGQSRVLQAYLPLEKQLDRLEESLDTLLAEALRTF